jgi:hypothetical protein
MTLLQAATAILTLAGACLAAYLLYRHHLRRNLEDRSALVERIALEQDSEDLGDAGEIMASIGGRGLYSRESQEKADTSHDQSVKVSDPESLRRRVEVREQRRRREQSPPLSAQAVATSFVNDAVSFHVKTLLAEIEKNDRRNARSSLISNLVFFMLGVATPIILKMVFGIG